MVLPRLSEQIDLEELWHTLGDCLSELDKTPDHHAVLILQPAVEAFFLVHAGISLYEFILGPLRRKLFFFLAYRVAFDTSLLMVSISVQGRTHYEEESSRI